MLAVTVYRATAPGARAAVTRGMFAAALLVGAGCASDVNREQLAVEYFNLGTGYLELGEAQQAADYFRRGLELNPDARDARYNLALALLELDDAAAAGGHLDLLLAADPGNVRVLELQAISYQRRGRLGDAVAAYRTLLQAQPDHAAARYNAAILLWSLAEFTAAAAELRTLLEHAPDDREARLRMGLLLAQTGPPEEAAAVRGEYLEAMAEDGEAMLALAQVEQERGRLEAALDGFTAAAALLPPDDARQPELAFERAVILLTELEDPNAGLAALETALDGGFDDRERLADLLAAERLVRREEVENLAAAHFPDPADAAEAAESAETAEPDQPAGAAERAAAGASADAADLAGAADPTAPAGPAGAEPSAPAEPTDAAASAEPAEATGTAEPAATGEPAPDAGAGAGADG